MRSIFLTLIDIFVINILFRFLSQLNLQYIIFAVNRTEDGFICFKIDFLGIPGSPLFHPLLLSLYLGSPLPIQSLKAFFHLKNKIRENTN